MRKLALLVAAFVLTASMAACDPPGVTFRDLDGVYPAGLPNPSTDPTFFPVGVWLACVETTGQATSDAALGINTYVAICANSDLDAVETSGMRLLAQANELAGSTHPAVDGWMVYDEADMTYGPGNDPWSGAEGWNTCIPIQDAGGQCGYTVMGDMAARVSGLRYANYGLGVATWESDDEAARFVNGPWQHVVSADYYYFTHPDVPAADRKGSSYGTLVDRLRYLDGLDGHRQPVWAVVELGHPFTEDTTPTITAPQVRSAVWHSIIAGARGIVYFNHSFGGPCPTQNVLRDGCDPAIRPAVDALDAQIKALAPVLNSQYADGYATVTSGDARVMVKHAPDGSWYVFAADTRQGGGPQQVTIQVASGSQATVIDENRTLPVDGGTVTDSFADGNAVHIYRIT